VWLQFLLHDYNSAKPFKWSELVQLEGEYQKAEKAKVGDARMYHKVAA
jgi:hypothetical protein